MDVLCFSSTEELRSIFDEGISVTFSDEPNMDCFRLNAVAKHKSCPRFRILIGTTPDHFKNIYARGRNLLEDQKITLIHELLHIFHYCITGQGFGLFQETLDPEQKEHERLIDEKAFEIVRQDDNLLVAIVLELSVRQKCFWKYEATDTPFFHFHRDLILSRLAGQGGQLKFGNPAQIKLLDLLRKIQA